MTLPACVSVRAGTTGSVATDDFRAPDAAVALGGPRAEAGRPVAAETRASPAPDSITGLITGSTPDPSRETGSAGRWRPDPASPRPSPLRPSAFERARTSTPDEARESILDASVRVGEPPPSPEPSRGVEGAVLIDSKVGDLNGEPIYANEIFAVVGDRLRAEAQRLDRNAWRQQARRALREDLTRRLETSVLEAEARASLPPEARRQGLIAVVQRMQADTIAQNFGSREIANQRLREQGFRDLDEYVDARLRGDLISLQIRRVIDRRVSVSFQEIQRAYENAFERFNPPAVAVFHQIEVPTGDESAIRSVASRLEGGETFIDVARDRVNMRTPETGGQTRFEFARDAAWEDLRIFNVPVLNEVALSLSPGEWSGPFEVGSTTRWLYLDRVERLSRSLYDVQELLRREIENAKQNFEFDRYTRSLLSAATYTDLDEMTERLLEIASQRYLPPETR
ncbi:MAG: hypothetical protein EA378_00655 [Phycisphaerales bacterium]|nr:MAG: hypothetical protein EA378_00655 [Phycisphaerales bacterium]